MIVNKSHEIEEQESGTYIFPDDSKFQYSWAIWLWPDGSADVYTKRNKKTGALLGKPIRLSASRKEK